MVILSQTRLIIFAPTTLQREAWRALLAGQPDIAVVGVASDTRALATLLQPGQPTSILIDLPAPQPDLARQLHGLGPDLGVLFLVQSYDLAQIQPLLGAGAAGCVSRDDTPTDLARAIVAAGRGELVLPPRIAGRALAALAQGKVTGEGAPESLSARETDVLHLLARGLTNKDIAQTLFLSVRTVEAHLRSIFAKLDVHSRTEAALWAVTHGYGSER